MSRSKTMILTGFLALILSPVFIKAEQETMPPVGNPVVTAQTIADSLMSVVQLPVANSLMSQISDLMKQERSQLSELEQQFRNEVDEEKALAVQARIREVKIGTELSLLRLQLEEADLRGDEALAARLEQSIATITAPPPPPVFVDRDVPGTHRN